MKHFHTHLISISLNLDEEKKRINKFIDSLKNKIMQIWSRLNHLFLTAH